MEHTKSTRREFCAHAVGFVAVGALIESCGGSKSPTSPSFNVTAMPTLNGTVSGNTISVNIDAASPLTSTGSAALVNSSAGSFLVTRTEQDSFRALTAICTHEACTVTGFESGTFTCPCHGSQYNTNGGVTRGPAVAPLRQFNTQFTNNVLTITV
jgi:Rieske Fe-S protein